MKIIKSEKDIATMDRSHWRIKHRPMTTKERRNAQNNYTMKTQQFKKHSI